MDGLGDPVDAGIAADSLVLGVDEDNLVVLVGGVLVDPVGVQDTQVGAAAADTLLSGGTEGALVLELVDTHVGRLTYRAISFCYQFWTSKETYRRWHPWAQASYGHHGGHGHGRQHSPAWPCSPDDEPCRGEKDGKPGG